MTDRRLLFVAAVAITLVNTALYSRTAGYEFVNYDDRLYVLQNPLIREFDTASIGRIFTRACAANIAAGTGAVLSRAFHCLSIPNYPMTRPLL